MKIRDMLNNPMKNIELSAKDNNLIKKEARAKFVEEFDKVNEMNVKERLNNLLSRIDAQGERIKKNIDIKEVMVYKKLISEFLKESVDSMTQFSKKNVLDRRGRHRIYAIIKKVDTELEDLTKDVLEKEKDKIKILKRLDDIRGLILDIYM